MKKGILLNLILAFAITVLTGCGLSEEAKAVQQEIDKLDKLNVDKEQQVSELAGEINTMIDELTIETKSSNSIQTTYKSIKAIMTKINETDKIADSQIKYEELAGKLAEIFGACNQIVEDMHNDADAIQNIADIATTLTTISSLSMSSIYGYCVDMSAELNGMTRNYGSNNELKTKIDELENYALYDDEFSCIMAKVYVYSAAIDVYEQITNYYQPYIEGIHMDTILADFNEYTNIIVERTPDL